MVSIIFAILFFGLLSLNVVIGVEILKRYKVLRPIINPFWKAYVSKGRLKFVEIFDGQGNIHFTVGHPEPNGVDTEPVDGIDFGSMEVSERAVSFAYGVPMLDCHAYVDSALDREIVNYATQYGINGNYFETIEQIPDDLDFYLYKCHAPIKKIGCTACNKWLNDSDEVCPECNSKEHIESAEYECGNMWDAPQDDLQVINESNPGIWSRLFKREKDLIVVKCEQCGSNKHIEAVHKTQKKQFILRNQIAINKADIRTFLDFVKSPVMADLRVQEAYLEGKKEGTNKSGEIFKFMLIFAMAFIMLAIGFQIFKSSCNPVPGITAGLKDTITATI